MPTYYHKPENALKRAKEFIEVDKKESALEVLNEVIKSKKHRSSGNKIHEEIANLFLVICTDLQKSSTAKNGLYQYRNISGNVDPASFDAVVKTFLRDANKRAKDAKELSQQAVLDIDDLDQLQTPESLLLLTVSDEDTQARTDRVMLTPWVKFLWESYRNILELTKNNQTFEKLYTEVAKEAFNFCIEYKRRTEFRKLCDTLRNHLQLIQKHQPPTQSYAINFSAPESKSIQFQVEVRFEQLECSIKIDLWQEAFKAIEEIHNLLTTTKTQSKPSTYFNFYSRQARVYWMAKNRLFHAAAVHCQFVLIKEQKKSSSHDELQRIASQVLLATMAIPIVPLTSESTRLLQQDPFSQDKDRRLAALLRLQSIPTRHSLHVDLERLGVLQYAPSDLCQLYQLLEVDYNPLTLCAGVLPILDGLESNELLKQYIEPLKSVTVVRLIKEVSQLYQSITFDRLQELVPFLSRWQLEKVVVETATSNKLSVHIDHHTKSLHFGTEMTTFSDEDSIPEGPYVQGLPSDQLRCHLTMMSQALNQVALLIGKERVMAQHEQEQARLVGIYRKHEAADRKALMRRQAAIEDRKECIEHFQKEKEHKEKQEKKEKERKEWQAEQERLKKERDEREKAKLQLDAERIKKQIQMDKLEQLKKSAVGHKILMDYDPAELDDIDPEEIMQKQLKQLEKQRKDLFSKLKQQEKRMDYFERAKRLEEIPLVQKYSQDQAENDKVLHERTEEERISNAITSRQSDMEKKQALEKMLTDRDQVLQEIRQQRHKAFQDKMALYMKEFDAKKAQRLEKRKEERKEKRKAEYLLTQKTKREEELKQAKEREERERKMALEKQEKMQREREREIEERQNEKRRRDEVEIQRKPPAESSPHTERHYVPPKVREEARFEERQRDISPHRGEDSSSSWRDRGIPRDRDSAWRREDSASQRDADGDSRWKRGDQDDWRRSDRSPRSERRLRDDDRSDGRRFDDRRDDRRFDDQRDDRRFDDRRDDRRFEDRRDDRRFDDRRDDRRFDDRRDDRRFDDRRPDRQFDDRRNERRYDDRRDDRRFDGRRDDRRFEDRRDDRRFDDRRDDRRFDDQRDDRRFDDRRDDRRFDDRRDDRRFDERRGYDDRWDSRRLDSRRDDRRYDDDRPSYRDDNRPPPSRDQDRPFVRDDKRGREDGESRRYVPPAARRQEGDRGEDGGWRGKDDRRPFKGREESGWRRGDKRDLSPPRKKGEREVDDDGFEVVRTRR